jgi:Xaa-Pro aminopeptidase
MIPQPGLPRRTPFKPVLLALGMMLAAGLPARAWERGPLTQFHDRRARLVKETGDGIIVMFGYREADVAATVTAFRQNENFYYLTGWNQPEAIMMVVPKVPKRGQSPEVDREILFIPAHDYRQERWTGPKLGPDDANATAETGFPWVRSTSLFQSELQDALKNFSKIYTELTPQPESGEDYFQAETVSKLHKMAPLATLADLRPLLSRMRSVKSADEIALIRKATEASVDAQLAAMRTVRPGVWEYEIAALVNYEYGRRGCEWPAYPPIVGSGFFSTVLHYDQNSAQMHEGDVVVIDAAGAYSGYTSDITRTLPVNGHFNPRQRELYEVVLGAQNAALSEAKPGMNLGRRGPKGLHEVAFEYINTHGKDLHGEPLGKYFIHGLSHSVGLNVHDPFDYNQPLQPGMVVTVEPGIYIPEEKIGIRIEDLILITEDGAEVLTARLPRTVELIERLMSHK